MKFENELRHALENLNFKYNPDEDEFIVEANDNGDTSLRLCKDGENYVIILESNENKLEEWNITQNNSEFFHKCDSICNNAYAEFHSNEVLAAFKVLEECK